MEQQQFRAFLALFLVAVLAIGCYVAWHYTHHHTVCVDAHGQPTSAYFGTCHQVNG